MQQSLTDTLPRPGYLSREYAESLGEWGEPLELAGARGWLLKRCIPGGGSYDAMGCYPLFCCKNWSALTDDFESLRQSVISIALVTDPFGDYDEALLRATFDRAIQYKEHFVADLQKPVNDLANWHHRKHARRALQDAVIDIPDEPVSLLEDWMSAYGTLIARHQITGLRGFSRRSFEIQLRLPGMVAIRARHAVTSELLGIQLWLVQDSTVYSHLSAYTELGYKRRVAYALNWTANEYFAPQARWIHLGAGAGTASSGTGLVEYKRGWATEVKPVWFCGKVLDPVAYKALTAATVSSETPYFPAYRKGEF